MVGTREITNCTKERKPPISGDIEVMAAAAEMKKINKSQYDDGGVPKGDTTSMAATTAT